MCCRGVLESDAVNEFSLCHRIVSRLKIAGVRAYTAIPSPKAKRVFTNLLCLSDGALFERNCYRVSMSTRYRHWQ